MKELMQAVSEVQKEVGFAKKDKEGYGYNYVSYPSLMLDLRPAMEKHGLVISHAIVTGPDGGAALRSRLFHLPSGEMDEAICPVIRSGVKGANDSQQIGSDVSYKRRYQTMAFFDIPHGDDADEKRFNAPSEKPSKGGGKPAPSRPAGWRGALSECRTVEDITRLFKGVSAGMDKESDEYAQLVNDCADRKAELA